MRAGPTVPFCGCGSRRHQPVGGVIATPAIDRGHEHRRERVVVGLRARYVGAPVSGGGGERLGGERWLQGWEALRRLSAAGEPRSPVCSRPARGRESGKGGRRSGRGPAGSRRAPSRSSRGRPAAAAHSSGRGSRTRGRSASARRGEPCTGCDRPTSARGRRGAGRRGRRRREGRSQTPDPRVAALVEPVDALPHVHDRRVGPPELPLVVPAAAGANGSICR